MSKTWQQWSAFSLWLIGQFVGYPIMIILKTTNWFWLGAFLTFGSWTIAMFIIGMWPNPRRRDD